MSMVAANQRLTVRPSISSLDRDTRPLSPLLRLAVAGTAGIDLFIGLAFLFGPDLKVTLWPTSIPPVLMRFIGSIVLANGVGAAMVAYKGTWGNARVLFAVAMVYGIAILPALLYHLLFKNADSILWLYVAADSAFLVPIGLIYWRYEYGWPAAGADASRKASLEDVRQPANARTSASE